MRGTLYALLEGWRAAKGRKAPGFPWVRSLRPPPYRLGGARRAVFSGHTAEVTAVAFSPDGRRVASGSADGSIRLWDVGDGAEIARLVGHENTITGIAFLPDGRTLISSSHDGTIRSWDLTDGNRQTSCLRGATAETVTSGRWEVRGGSLLSLRGIWCLAVFPNGDQLISGDGSASLSVWDRTSEAKVGTLQTGCGVGITHIALSPDGRYVAAGSDSKGCVEVWDVAAARNIIGLHPNGIQESGERGRILTCLSFSPDGRSFIVGSRSGELRVYELPTGKELTCLTSDGVTAFCLAVSPDGNRIIGGFRDGTIRLWDVPAGREVGVLPGHGGSVWCVAVSPSGEEIVSGGEDNSVVLWTASGRGVAGRLQDHASPIEKMSQSDDGRLLATGGRDRTIRVWDAARGTHLTVLEGHKGRLKDLAFSPGGKQLASASADTTVRIWGIRTGKEVLRLGTESEAYGEIANVRDTMLELGRGKAVPRKVRFLPGGRRLVVLYQEDEFGVWDTRTGRKVIRFGCTEEVTGRSYDGGIKTFALSRDGKQLAADGTDGVVRVWDVATGTLQASLRGHDGPVKCVAFAPNDQQLASGGKDGTIRVWHVKNETQVMSCRYRCTCGKVHKPQEVAFSPNSQLVVAEWDYPVLEVYHVATGQFVRGILGFGDVRQIAAGMPAQKWHVESAYHTGRGEAEVTEVTSKNNERHFRHLWFPHPVEVGVRYPSGPTCAGKVGNHLYVLRIEEG